MSRLLTDTAQLASWSYGVAIILYTLAWGIIWQRARQSKDTAPPRLTALILVAVGLAAHSLGLYAKLAGSHSLGGLTLDISLGIVTWMAVLLYWLVSWWRPVVNLGIAVLPASMLALAIALMLFISTPGDAMTHNTNAQGLPAHLLTAVFTFGVLTLAFAQAVLLTLQEHQLRQHLSGNSHGFFFPALPPLQSMEKLLFELLILGFILLTASFVLGIAHAHGTLGTTLPFNHHTLLTIFAWAGFGLIIAGHYLRGWRGQQAARYTMIGFGVFLLAYFGPRVVRELIL